MAIRKVGITDKDVLLITLLREVPFLTRELVKEYFYPSNKRMTYTLEKLGYLIKNGIVNKFRKGDGNYIYYLSKFGHETSKKYHWKIPKIDQKNLEITVIPNAELEFKEFTPYHLDRNPFHHTISIVEFYKLVSQSRCFYNRVYLDSCKNRIKRLNLSAIPDLLISNGIDEENGRIFVEIENSKIRDARLASKLNNLCKNQADYYFFLATDNDIFLNLGRLIRKILSGESRERGRVLYFAPEARSAVIQKLLIGKWVPSIKNDGIVSKISQVELYRYDHEIFDTGAWVNKIVDGITVKDEISGKPIKEFKRVPFSGRKSGKNRYLLSEIFMQYRTHFEKMFRESFPASRN